MMRSDMQNNPALQVFAFPHEPSPIISIAPGVFEAISDDIPFAVIPQENSVYGHVTETYDALRSPKAGQSVFVRGELPLAIKHCLVVRQGVQLADVERVMSHEQVRSQRSQRPSC